MAAHDVVQERKPATMADLEGLPEGVDLEASLVMVNRLENGRWLELGVFGRGGKMRAEPFDALELDLAKLLQP